MKRLVVIFFLVLGIINLVFFSRVESSEKSSLSPYFFIEGGDSSLEHFPLKDTRVEVSISGVIAAVTVRQVYSNMGGVPINGKYIFPGSTRAAVHGMKMTIGERVIRARIKEKDQARKAFKAAKQQGKNASLLEQQRPNVFSMEVANVMPGDTIEIELSYTELLVPQNGTYQFVYPTVVGPRYTSQTSEQPPASERWVQNPYLKKGSAPRTDFSIDVSLAAGMPIQEISSRSHDIDIAFGDQSRAQVSLTTQDGFAGDRDFILDYRLSGRQISSGLILQQGEDENFFLLMTQPPRQVEPHTIPTREYLFVIDVSGSMSGYPLDSAKRLVKDLIGGMRSTDSFNVLFFAGDSKVLSETPIPAAQANIDRAVAMIEHSRGGGGTELKKAMNRAMNLPKQEGVSRTMVVITDGYIRAEQEVFELIQQNLNHTNVFAFGIGSSVNRYLIEGMAKAGQGEPFVVTKPDEAQAAAERFGRYISQPVLTDIEVTFPGLDTYDVEPPVVPDLFAQRPIIVMGKWRGEPAGLVRVSGNSGEGRYERKIPVGGAVTSGHDGSLHYLWARTRISRIADFKARQDSNEQNREEIVALGLKYNLLTRFTSFIAIDEIVRNLNLESKNVKQPLPLPRNVSNLAVGGGVRRVPEPELYLLAVLVLLSMVLPRLRRNKALSVE
ncbi:MAG: VIT and VWA domain-containing protein [Desulfofustis sp.]|nr:VIT and VWA domain-containing protein [Desulfofustis sp.]